MDSFTSTPSSAGTIKERPLPVDSLSAVASRESPAQLGSLSRNVRPQAPPGGAAW